MRINALARQPGNETRARYILDDEKSGAPSRVRRARCSAHRTRSCASSNSLRAGGVEYVIINFGGSRENIRRFAREIMPAFADEPALALAGQ